MLPAPQVPHQHIQRPQNRDENQVREVQQRSRPVSAERTISKQSLSIEVFCSVARSGFGASNDLGGQLLLLLHPAMYQPDLYAVSDIS